MFFFFYQFCCPSSTHDFTQVQHIIISLWRFLYPLHVVVYSAVTSMSMCHVQIVTAEQAMWVLKIAQASLLKSGSQLLMEWLCAKLLCEESVGCHNTGWEEPSPQLLPSYKKIHRTPQLPICSVSLSPWGPVKTAWLGLCCNRWALHSGYKSNSDLQLLVWRRSNPSLPVGWLIGNRQWIWTPEHIPYWSLYISACQFGRYVCSLTLLP